MDAILGFFGSFSWLLIVAVVVVFAVIALAYVRTRYMIANANQALVITGGHSDPKILVGGGAFVPPNRKGAFFDLGLKTVGSTNDATVTSTMIPVMVEWTAQLRADTSKDADGQLNQSLRNAILGFTNYKGDVSESLQQTLEGDVRAVIGDMTPEDLVRNKVGFAERVDQSVNNSMSELGYKLVSLNIGKITDPNGYYDNLAAKDREARRSESANLKAEADQGIAVAFAVADRASKAAEQQRDMAITDQARELALRRAAVKAETDIAEADAAIAGQLQKELRSQDLAQREGQVAVVREQQRQAAAIARREVEVTEAETEKQRQQIQAESASQQSQIQAGAAAAVAKQTAQGEADAKVAKAEGEATAINRTTEARANEIRQTGIAQAEVARAQGEAEAAAILARGTSEAEAQRLMAEALAANEGANLRVTLAQIESTTRVTVATQTATVMAEIGKNAKFVDMGGGSNQDGSLFTRVLGDLPALLNKLDVRSDALNDTTFSDLIGSVIAGMKGGAQAGDVSQASEGSKPEVTVPVKAVIAEVQKAQPSDEPS